jgi:hypothetical protein
MEHGRKEEEERGGRGKKEMINGNLQWAMLLRKEEEFEFLKSQGN